MKDVHKLSLTFIHSYIYKKFTFQCIGERCCCQCKPDTQFEINVGIYYRT